MFLHGQFDKFRIWATGAQRATGDGRPYIMLRIARVVLPTAPALVQPEHKLQLWLSPGLRVYRNDSYILMTYLPQ